MKPLDLLIAVTVPMLWGAGFAVAKGTFDEFPPIFLMGLRFTLAAAVLIWFVAPMWDRLGRMALLGLVGGVAAYGLQFTGLAGMNASTAILVVQIEVVFVTILAGIFFRDRLQPAQWIAMAAAAGGVATMAGEPDIRSNPLPFAMVVAGGLAWAGGQILVKSLGPVGGLRAIAWFAALAGPQMLAASLLVETGQWEAVRSASWRGWAAVLYLALAMTAAGYALWFRLLGVYRMNRVAPFILLTPVAGVLGAVLFLGETLSGWTVAGGAIVMASVAFIHLRHARAEAPRRSRRGAAPWP